MTDVIRTSNPMTPAARSVLAERLRQIQSEGWTPEHDDKHKNFELTLAAVSYADLAARPRLNWLYDPGPRWPWSRGWWKPRGARRDLVRAAALILAEIERLDRAFPMGIPADANTPETPDELSRLRTEVTTLKGVCSLWGLNPDPAHESNAVRAELKDAETPEYRKWPGEPPHCMSCDCGMTDEQKRMVPEEDYLRIHRELMDLKYPGGRQSEKAGDQQT